MKRKNDELLKALVILFSGGIIMLLSSCLTMDSVTRHFAFRGSAEERHTIDQKYVAKFVSKILPPRGNAESHYLLAGFYQMIGKHRKAVEEYEKVILIDPAHVKAYTRMGVSFDYMQDFPRAVENYEKALMVNGDLDYVYNNLGYSFLMQGEVDSAIEAFQKAISIDNKNSRFHNNLGLAYSIKGRSDLAREEFRAAGGKRVRPDSIVSSRPGPQTRDMMRGNNAHSAGTVPLPGESADTQEEVILVSGISEPYTEMKGKDGAGAAGTEVRMSTETRELVASVQKVIGDALAVPLAGTYSPAMDAPRDAGNAILPAAEGTQMTASREGGQGQPGQKDAEEKENPSDTLSIEISNGNGMNSMARRVGDYLKGKGFQVTRLTNADHFGYKKTMIYYRIQYLHDAYRVAQQVPGYQNMEKVRQFDRPSIKIRVLIGNDMIPHNKTFVKGYQRS